MCCSQNQTLLLPVKSLSEKDHLSVDQQEVWDNLDSQGSWEFDSSLFLLGETAVSLTLGKLHNPGTPPEEWNSDYSLARKLYKGSA